MIARFLAAVTLSVALLPAVASRAHADVSAQTRSPHGNLNIPCQNCHTSLGWKPIRAVPEFDHNKTSYPLRGMHENVSCTQCHTKPVFTNVGNKCAACHADIHRGQMGARCEQCHSVQGWNIAIKDIQNHENRFPLVGAHAALQCDDCHKSAAVGQFQGLSTACYSCHQKTFQQATNPNHVAGGFSTTCETCHSVDTWLNAKFDHSQTGFPLTGMHQQTPCASCHANNNYNLTAADTVCVNCHQKDFNATTNPNHVTGHLPTTCQQCHTTAGWQPASFDHNTVGFPLTGMHTVPPRACSDCHVNNNYNLTSTTCVSCHLTDFQNAKNPDHVAGGFSQQCQTCHNTNAWQPAQFDHTASGFPLTGAHAVPPRQCTDCHVNNNFTLTNTACVSCHQQDYNNALTPVDHISANFPTTCQSCHDTVLWTDGKFDHTSTGFALTGLHTVPPRQCSDCHVNNNYNLTTAACVSCHLRDYQGTTNPNHVSSNFPQACDQCHNTSSWLNATFNHDITGFPLTGLHTVPPRQCTDCHVNNNYNLTTAACVSCHLKDYQGTTNPNHVASNFPQTCDQCHNTSSWLNATFNHSTTGFPLTGSHTVPPRQCTDCHINNNYNITNTACVSCHQQDYNTALSPVNHISANFPTTCESCHDTVLWTDGKFDHTATGFTLTGMHTVPPRLCTDCHVNNNYNLTSTACVTCHQADYNSTTNPPHASAGFPTGCQMCHDTVNWTDGTFNHASTGWALTGFHTTVQCGMCHVNNNYSLTTANTLCSSCHMADWNSTTNPVHASTGWPNTCDTCHNTTAWIPANLPLQYHTMWDPNHGGANSVCTTCHTNPNDYSVFTCTNCHQKAQTDSDHQGVQGYVYNSVNCYNCHKNGGGGGGSM